ncbi:MAG TPA: DUF6776 family protein [Methylibium sp.]|uniref:DUF6776 family protein n=1 Tax=Methylibium sp. TaxID=2067992 RepID=UPI002DBD1C65|nr:DUF6776 family protein [Methylibium sp.]HEU4459227.1 DUF6776 family protein [Methylibium sp.]
MRWKLLRRRLSISAPRMIVRSHLPWPLRWIVFALALGFSAALALWAFEFGKDIAGVDRIGKAELQRLRLDVAELRSELDKAQSIANTAESRIRTERTALERLASQVRSLEAENLGLKNDLGFFERLLPAGGKGDLVVRGLQAEVVGQGRLRYQLLVMQQGRTPAEFKGRYELTLRGQLDGRAWSQAIGGPARSLQFRQYQRVDGTLEFPQPVTVQAVQVRVLDPQGGVRASQDLAL